MLDVSHSGFYAGLRRPPSARTRTDTRLTAHIQTSFAQSDRTYGARRVWRDLRAWGLDCGLHRVERLMRLADLRARPRRRRLPQDGGPRPAQALAPNVLARQFEAPAPNQKGYISLRWCPRNRVQSSIRLPRIRRSSVPCSTPTVTRSTRT